MFNSRNTTKLMQTQLQFEFDKKEFLAKAEQDRKDLLTAAEINRQKMSRNYSLQVLEWCWFLAATDLPL
jgi:hypothetical protein